MLPIGAHLLNMTNRHSVFLVLMSSVWHTLPTYFLNRTGLCLRALIPWASFLEVQKTENFHSLFTAAWDTRTDAPVTRPFLQPFRILDARRLLPMFSTKLIFQSSMHPFGIR